MDADAVFLIGAEVRGSDRPVGTVARLVVEPGGGRLTHLAVQPSHRRGPARLVPLGLVARCAGDIVLTCTAAEFAALPAVRGRRRDAAPGGAETGWHVDLATLPGVPIVATGRAMGLGLAADRGDGHGGTAAADRGVVPCATDEVCAGRHVRARDGDGGHVRGLTVGEAGRVTGLLLDWGHAPLRRRVLVPAEAVTSLHGTIRVALTRQELTALAEAGGAAGGLPAARR